MFYFILEKKVRSQTAVVIFNFLYVIIRFKASIKGGNERKVSRGKRNEIEKESLWMNPDYWKNSGAKEIRKAER